ncbi:AEC family transporter [Mailhella massiliensis]|uniref:AEC family transporter n=1 Tax=Mailhella massiliensis TaxID=1903261 RepID=A0A921AY20_9BACT|nr:AEC family transporter [Mailhella massiliensis]HJD97873.1 AEC family transporter [Mailhella massiliensis]
MSGILSALVTVFGIIFLGLVAERRRIFAPSMALCLNQFVYWVSLPALIFMQMCTIPMDGAQPFIWGTLAASLLFYLAAYLFFSRFWKRHDPIVTIRTLAAAFPNAAFFGLPFIFMVFPGNEEAVSAGMLGALLYTGVFLTADATLDMLSPGREKKGLGLRLFKELTHNPMLVSALIGASLGFFGVPVPTAFVKIAEMLGSTAAPCALFGMGMVLSAQLSGTAGAGEGFSRKNIAVVAVLKLLLQPLVTFLALLAAGCSGTALITGTVTAAMPTATMVYILGERYRARPMEASMTVIATTLLSLLTLPLVMFALSLAGLV